MAEKKNLASSKIAVTKIDAATSQLCEAIMLFFERRDPISIHTLAWASLEIIHSYISGKRNKAIDPIAITHPKAIHIKDEYKKKYYDLMRENRNFFKHGKKDLNATINFNTELNELVIAESCFCLANIDINSLGKIPEINIFISWFIIKYPESLQDAYKKSEDYKKIKSYAEEINPDNYNMCLKTILHIKDLRGAKSA